MERRYSKYQEDEKNEKGKKKRKVILIILGILTFIFVTGGVMYFIDPFDTYDVSLVDANLDPNARDYTKDEPEKVQEEASLITVDGFGEMSFKANSLNQKVDFHNDSKNNCYMVFALYLPNGTKIYESKLVEPGKAIYEIKLNQKLSAGVYENAILMTSCYANDGLLSNLNPSQVKFTLRVI